MQLTLQLHSYSGVDQRCCCDNHGHRTTLGRGSEQCWRAVGKRRMQTRRHCRANIQRQHRYEYVVHVVPQSAHRSGNRNMLASRARGWRWWWWGRGGGGGGGGGAPVIISALSRRVAGCVQYTYLAVTISVHSRRVAGCVQYTYLAVSFMLICTP